MSAERGASRGTATLTRPSFSGERRGSISRSVISLPRAETRSFSRPHRTMSRADFGAKYRPFTPDLSQRYYPDSYRKPQQLITRQFSTYRDGATMQRSAINRTKGEIKTRIDVKIPQTEINETKRSIPKMQLYELRERPKVSLIKKISLEKRKKDSGIHREEPTVSLLKKVNSLKKNNKKRELFAGMTNEKFAITKHPIEQPIRKVEKQLKTKEQIFFKAEQNTLKPDLQQKKLRVTFAEINKPVIVTPDQFTSVITQAKNFTKELQYTKEEINSATIFERNITPPKVEQIIFQLKNRQTENELGKGEKIQNKEDEPKLICFWKDLIKIGRKEVIEKAESAEGKVVKKGKTEGKVQGIVSRSIAGDVIQAPPEIKKDVCRFCANYLRAKNLKLTIVQEPTH